MLLNLKRVEFQELRSIVPFGRCIRTNPFDVAFQIRKSFKKKEKKKKEKKEKEAGKKRRDISFKILCS